MVFAGGVGDWRSLANVNDPLPRAMKMVVGGRSGWLHMLVWLGLFGLVASLHGIIFGYSRQIYALRVPGISRGFWQGAPALPNADGRHSGGWAGWNRGHLQR